MLWSINVQSTANLFRAIALVEEECPTVVVVFQEPDFCPRQQGQVRALLNSTGYASWTVEAGNAGGRHRGGLVVAVRSSIRTHVLQQLACPGGVLHFTVL